VQWKDVKPTLPLWALGAAAGAATAVVERKLIGAEGAEFDFTLIERALIAGRVVWFYLGKLIWPAELMFNYPRWQISVRDAAGWIGLVSMAGVMIGLAAASRGPGLRSSPAAGVRRGAKYVSSARGALAALLFFGGSLLPVLGFFNVYPFVFSFVADHFQYVAAMGPLTLAGALLARSRWSQAAGWMIVAALAVLSWRQAHLYQSAEGLYRATLRSNPRAWMAGNNLARVLLDLGQAAEALPISRRMVEVKGDRVETRLNHASVLSRLGDHAPAAEQIEAAMRLRGELGLTAEEWITIGSIHGRAGRYPEAERAYRQALSLSPGHGGAMYNLGQSLAAMGRWEEALEALNGARAAANVPPDVENMIQRVMKMKEASKPGR
jgi:Flp pilus assembly protein TadD